MPFFLSLIGRACFRRAHAVPSASRNAIPFALGHASCVSAVLLQRLWCFSRLFLCKGVRRERTGRLRCAESTARPTRKGAGSTEAKRGEAERDCFVLFCFALFFCLLTTPKTPNSRRTQPNTTPDTNLDTRRLLSRTLVNSSGCRLTHSRSSFQVP